MATRLGNGLASGVDSRDVGRRAAEGARARVGGERIALVIVFASPAYDLEKVLEGIREVFGPAPLMGCTSAGEFSEQVATTGSVAVTAIASDSLQARVSAGREFGRDLKGSVSRAVGSLAGKSDAACRSGNLGRTLFLLTDGLAGRAEELIDELGTQTGMQYQLFGGAAGDDARFKETYVFCEDEVLTGAFVCAEVLSERPMGIGIGHGWRCASAPMRVTGAEGTLLRELNGRPAWELYEEYSARSGASIDEGQTSAFLMDHILGVSNSPEGCKLRVPLWKKPDGSLVCAAEVPSGALVRIMEADNAAIVRSGAAAVERARLRLGGATAAGALVFECVATRLRLGAEFPKEVESMSRALGPVPLTGCNSYGQLARIKGEFTGLMDATALVCLIPE